MLDADDVLARLGSRTGGLAEDEAARRLSIAGANAVRSYRVRALPVLVRQLRSPLLVVLAVTAVASAFLGEATDAVIIGVILAASVGLGFVNQYRAEKTADALHSTIRHSCLVVRDGHPQLRTLLIKKRGRNLRAGQAVEWNEEWFNGLGLHQLRGTVRYPKTA